MGTSHFIKICDIIVGRFHPLYRSPSSEKKPGQKAARVWALGGNSTDSKVLDYSGGEVPPEGAGVNGGLENVNEEEVSRKRVKRSEKE